MQKPLRLGILFYVLRNGTKNGFGMYSQHRKFIEQRGIEHYVGILLVGEYPSLLATSYGIPHIKRSLNTRAAAFEVTNRATEKSES